jgi:two-component system, NtrC family, nitrogen regulation response regulator GlnG
MGGRFQVSDSSRNSKNISLVESVSNHINDYFAAHDGDMPESGLYHRIITEIEKILIEKTLLATNFNQMKASKILGINRNTLRKKILLLKVHVAPLSRVLKKEW